MKEKSLIVRILLSENKISRADFVGINFERFVKISTSHLILPALYLKIKTKKITKYFPEDLLQFMKNIYEENLKRNKHIQVEVKFINQIFKKNSIEFVFLKGAAMLIDNYFSEIGERMIGDIDILVSKTDSSKAFKILSNHGYNIFPEYDFFPHRSKKHLKRQVNKEKIFAVEIHYSLLRNKNELLDSNKILSNLKKVDSLPVPNSLSLFYHCIYNQEINDKGFLLMNFNYRSLYDHKLIYDRNKFEFDQMNNDKFVSSFYFKLNKIMGHQNLYFDYNKSIFFRLRFYLKNNFKKFNFIDNLIYTQLYYLRFRPEQFIKFLNDKTYRNYIFKKLFNY